MSIYARSGRLGPVTNARVDPVVVEAYAMTSADLVRPPVEVYLRGVAEEPEVPETWLAWRRDVADLEGAFEATRGDTDLPGGGAISQHARFSCVGFRVFPSIQGYFRGSRVRAIARAAPLFGTASTCRRRPPDLSRARWLSSRRGSDTSDRLEGGHVDAAFVEDRLHPLRGPSMPLQALLGVLRVAVLRRSLAPGAARGGGPELGEDVVHPVLLVPAALELADHVRRQPAGGLLAH